MKKALFVIDVQNFFINSKTKDLPNKIVQYIKKNKNLFDLIIFTQFVNDPTSQVYQLLDWKKCSVSPEIDIVEEFKPLLKYGVIFTKNVYSVLKIPKLISLLRQHKIGELYLCGIDTDCCVLATAYDGFDQGYKIYLLEELCRASSKVSLHNAALSIFKRNLLK